MPGISQNADRRAVLRDEKFKWLVRMVRRCVSLHSQTSLYQTSLASLPPRLILARSLFVSLPLALSFIHGERHHCPSFGCALRRFVSRVNKLLLFLGLPATPAHTRIMYTEEEDALADTRSLGRCHGRAVYRGIRIKGSSLEPPAADVYGKVENLTRPVSRLMRHYS
jgi:hypothetical protein